MKETSLVQQRAAVFQGGAPKEVTKNPKTTAELQALADRVNVKGKVAVAAAAFPAAAQPSDTEARLVGADQRKQFAEGRDALEKRGIASTKMGTKKVADSKGGEAAEGKAPAPKSRLHRSPGVLDLNAARKIPRTKSFSDLPSKIESPVTSIHYKDTGVRRTKSYSDLPNGVESLSVAIPYVGKNEDGEPEKRVEERREEVPVAVLDEAAGRVAERTNDVMVPILGAVALGVSVVLAVKVVSWIRGK